jgi:hypothetical protein
MRAVIRDLEAQIQVGKLWPIATRFAVAYP